MFHDYEESGPGLLGNQSARARAKFRMTPSNTTLANTLRRQVLSAVQSIGFRTEPIEKSEVIITTNTTPIVNEMLAHRIGMIPVKADTSTFDPARYTFHIEKENDTKSMMDIHASDFVITERNPEDPLDEGHIVDASSFFPPDPITGETCLITRLRPQWNPIAPNEKLVVTAKASVSSGAENSRWCPVSQCSFENTRDDNPERQETMFRQWLSESKKIAEISNVSEERLGELQREYMSMEVQRCFRVDPETGDPNDFTFYVESVGVQSVPAIVQAGLQACEDMVTKYQDIDGVLPENVTIQQGDAQFPCVDILFKGEGHTLGNLLQHYLTTNHVEGAEEPRITFAGYKIPHPLKAEMVLRIGVQVGEDTEVAENIEDADNPQTTRLDMGRMAIAKVCRFLKAMFKGIQQDWLQVLSGTAQAAAAEGNVTSM